MTISDEDVDHAVTFVDDFNHQGLTTALNTTDLPRRLEICNSRPFCGRCECFHIYLDRSVPLFSLKTRKALKRHPSSFCDYSSYSRHRKRPYLNFVIYYNPTEPFRTYSRDQHHKLVHSQHKVVSKGLDNLSVRSTL